MDHYDLSNKIISRNSSIGCSSRVYYYRSSEGVPFKWERQPGTPREPPQKEPLPPLSPPPAILSLGLPKPCIEDPKPSNKPRLWFRKKKTSKNIKSKEGSKKEGTCISTLEGVDVFASVEFRSFDSEFMASPRTPSSCSYSSSSSSSFKSANGESLQPSRDVYGSNDLITCSPFNFRRNIIRVVRRI